MSAWMVSKAHIDALVKAGLEAKYGVRYGAIKLDIEQADYIGQQLWNENLKSIHHRYPDTLDSTDNVPGPIDFVESDVVVYHFDTKTWINRGKVDPVKMLKAISCYEYQSCEHDGWQDSLAHDYCESLRSDLISRLDGYDDAPWGVDSIDAVMPSKVVA